MREATALLRSFQTTSGQGKRYPAMALRFNVAASRNLPWQPGDVIECSMTRDGNLRLRPSKFFRVGSMASWERSHFVLSMTQEARDWGYMAGTRFSVLVRGSAVILKPTAEIAAANGGTGE